ncbi:MAG: hypothetical protein A2498_14875 [Lentisphaerae bacterium RIFOXYC12_FULL_60_16]|nr:MAG: hypothetical protein A2498_14875 [Lentisphaerae bacterium RIFOXYC12_FULL_60_16]OGV75092.1 MAG: hypothetical protein A2269_08525 [Lentisphaerae bacterium RIFOXYA12_FULL_60_10]OGV80370.1 MAG: hypothetical protein A2340_15210 [Lentisphaerae bacterium RIFOXYB12_FULL_60_10]
MTTKQSLSFAGLSLAIAATGWLIATVPGASPGTRTETHRQPIRPDPPSIPASLPDRTAPVTPAAGDSPQSPDPTFLPEPGLDPMTFLSEPLNCGDPAIEIEAMRRLIQAGDPRSLARVLGKMLTLDPSSERTQPYLSVFAECRNPSVPQWLVAALNAVGPGPLRQQAAWLLSILSGPETTLSLSLAIEEASREALPYETELALMVYRTDISEVQALMDVFDHTTVPELKVSAAFAMAGIGTAEACDFLVGVSLRNDPSAGLALAVIPLIRSAFAQESLLHAALDINLPPPTRVAAVSALQTHTGVRVDTALSNMAVSADHPDLLRAVETTLAAHSTTGETGENSGAVVMGRHELCF